MNSSDGGGKANSDAEKADGLVSEVRQIPGGFIEGGRETKKRAEPNPHQTQNLTEEVLLGDQELWRLGKGNVGLVGKSISIC